jgi:hypothetical protein
VPTLLNHLLDCRAVSERERGRDIGTQPLPTADGYLLAGAYTARANEGIPVDQWYREAGILSRTAEGNIREHEMQPDANMVYHRDRPRQHIKRRLLRRGMLEEDDES